MRSEIKLALILFLLPIARGPVSAQDRVAIFDDIERTIAQKEPNWILTKWPNPDPQYRVTMHHWAQSGKEINIWMVEEHSVEDAARVFYEIANPDRSFAQLPIGDKCYVIIFSPSGMTLLMRKGNLVAKMTTVDAVSGPKAPQDDLLRFAQHIAAAVPSAATSDTTSLDATPLRTEGAEAHYRLGTASYETGDYRAAASAFEETIRLQPECFDPLIALGKAYQHLGLHTRAVEVLQKAMLLRPDNIDARTALGTALILAGQPQDAIAVLREAARLAPESALIHASLGQAYRLSGNFDEALTALQQALRLSLEDPVVHNYLALTYSDLGKHAEALAAYKRAIALKADYAEAHYNVGLLYVAIGDRSQAQAEYEILKRLHSDLADVLLRKIR